MTTPVAFVSISKHHHQEISSNPPKTTSLLMKFLLPPSSVFFFFLFIIKLPRNQMTIFSRKLFLLLFSLILSNIFPLAVTQPLNTCFKNAGNYTSNSTYLKNLNTLFSSISSNTDEYGFYNNFTGTNSDRVYGNALCRGDIQPDTCRSCINETANLLVSELCPGYKEAVAWPDKCALRYSSKDMTGVMTDSPKHAAFRIDDARSADQFNQVLRRLLESLRDKAASGGSLRKFAVGDAPGPDFLTIYGLVQCTPDLSQVQCKDCLQGLIGYIGDCCNNKTGAKIVNPSCNLRYEVYTYYNETAVTGDAPPPDAPPPDTASNQIPPPPPPPDTNIGKAGKKSNSTRTVLISVGAALIVLVALIFLILFLWRSKHKKQNQEVETMDEITTIEALRFDFRTIRNATDDFSDENKLGQGGFGVVYKGKLPSGKEVAVKRLTENSGHGEEQFRNEVVLMVKLQHRNLVSLLGFCLEGTERLLIYEFVINSSLDNFIFDVAKRENLDWEKRQKIIEGVARGILYLHEDSQLRIIHRDLKASNILLDANMNPKIADFGTARLFDLDQTQASTSILAGTYGYMAPEYVRGGHISVKIDVFSFGVLVLEIVSGQKNNGVTNDLRSEGLLSYAWRSWREGMPSNVIDPVLRRGSSPVSEMIRCIHIGLLCVQENAARRPTIASVLLMLRSSSVTLPIPSRPAFLLQSATLAETSSDGTTSTHSNDVSFKAELSITELFPR